MQNNISAFLGEVECNLCLKLWGCQISILALDYLQSFAITSEVSNFFSNLGEIRNFVNNLLQLRFADTGITLSRFLVNTTVGIAGLWDPATKMGIFEKREDFGQNKVTGVWVAAPI